jgi:hypothetical protein
MLSSRHILQKNLKFMNGGEYLRQKSVCPPSPPPHLPHHPLRRGKSRQGSLLSSPKENKSPFLSIIRRSRINNFTASKFVEYEIVCQLRLASTQVEKEKVFKWSVWKRFSDFEQLHATLKQTLGWQMENAELPSSHTLTFNKFAPDFTEQRRSSLPLTLSPLP